MYMYMYLFKNRLYFWMNQTYRVYSNNDKVMVHQNLNFHDPRGRMFRTYVWPNSHIVIGSRSRLSPQ